MRGFRKKERRWGSVGGDNRRIPRVPVMQKLISAGQSQKGRRHGRGKDYIFLVLVCEYSWVGSAARRKLLDRFDIRKQSMARRKKNTEIF